MVVLLDADGVLSDFVRHVHDTYFDLFGIRKADDSVVSWDVFSSLGATNFQRKQVMKELERPGWIEAMPLLDGAQSFVETLREEGHDIVCVTSPWESSPTWDFERRNWLKKNLGIRANKVIFATDKFLVRGDVLIDDRSRNVRMWTRENCLGLGLLFDQSYNRGLDSEGLRRARGYKAVLEEMDKYATGEVLA